MNVLKGVPAAPGIAWGAAWVMVSGRASAPSEPVDPEAELSRVRAALDAADQALTQLERTVAARSGATEAAIFGAQRLMLRDPEWVDRVERLIREAGLPAVAAVEQAAEAVARELEALGDPVFSARGADIRDVGRAVQRELAGPGTHPHWAASPGDGTLAGRVVVAEDLTPSETVGLQEAGVAGLVMEGGSATGHAAILARALGIPAVVGVAGVVHAAAAACAAGGGARCQVALDGQTGSVWIEPPPSVLADLDRRRRRRQAISQALRERAAEPAVTRDGVRVRVGANVGAAAEVVAAVRYGAEEVGLFRTEFLYLERSTLPGQAEQAAVYREAARALGGRWLTVRTLDSGGDKPLPALTLPPEANPFLGVRGVRLTLRHPELVEPQLKALLEVAAEGAAVRVMFPMVATVEELDAALQQLDRAAEALGVRWRELAQFEVGIMVEVPSAALLAHTLAKRCAFFSFGTNDLTQYVLAADRGHPELAEYHRLLHPAVLRLMAETTRAAHAEGRWVGVCGELAGDPLAIPLLVGIGIDELSMAPDRVPLAKEVVRHLSMEQTRQLARRGLESPTPETLAELVRRTVPQALAVGEEAARPGSSDDAA